MSGQALGLVETRGMLGAIEAADTAAKTAAVRLLGFERVGAGLVMLRLCGDVGSVQTAVEAAARAAARVGELVGSHVIARPHEDLVGLLEIDSDSTDSSTAVGATPSPEPAVPQVDDLSPQTLSALPVARLRHLARNIAGLPLKGREISRANKAELLEALAQVRRGGGD